MARILLFLLLFCSPVLAQDQSSASSNADRENVIESQLPRIISILSDLESVLDYYSRQAAQNNYPDQSTQIAASDLILQERMAISTEDMAFYAAVAVFLSVIGLIMLGLTLHYTKRAASDTKKMLVEAKAATKAAERQVSIAERAYNSTASSVEIAGQAMERQLRAYITVDEITIDGYESSDYRFSAGLELSNTGQTPAYEIKILFELFVLPERLSDEFKPQGLIEKPQKLNVGVIGGNSKHPANLSLKIHDRIASGELLYLCGQIQYRDIFNRTFMTNFFWILDPDLNIIVRSHIGNEAT